jgi:hypothetical protein
MTKPFAIDLSDSLGGEVACESDDAMFWGKGIWHHNTSKQ